MTRFTISLILVALLVSTGFAVDSSSEAERWEKKYEQLLKDRPDIRKKVESGGATKEQVIAWMKRDGDRQKAKGEKKYYGAKIEVKDPAEFHKVHEKVIYSGPQPGEPLPAFNATGLKGKLKGKLYDPVARADGKPLVLIFQDNSVVGQKGLLLCGNVLATIAEKSPQGLHVSTTFLVDDPTLSKIFEYNFMDEIDNAIKMSVSRDRRDGPGAYGLNRNVAMTIIVARQGKVLHNFALKQPMLYPDPYVMGAIADAIGVDRPTLAGWFREDITSTVAQRREEKEQAEGEERSNKVRERSNELGNDSEAAGKAAFGAKLRELISAGKISREEAGELYRAAFPDGETRREGQERQSETETGRRRQERQYRNRRQVEVKDPSGFAKAQDKKLFSGPQPKEKLPAVTAIGIRGDLKDKEFDPVAEAKGKPQILVFQDDSGVGLRGMIGLTRIVAQVAERSESGLQYAAVFLGDDPAKLSEYAMRVDQHVPDFVKMGVSKDGRDGPGAYGLNRNVSMTILIAKDGKVTHNFAFPQSMLYPDPHILGALADVVGERRETVAAWLNDASKEETAMRSNDAAGKGDVTARRAELRRRFGALVEAGKVTRQEAAELYSAAFP